MITITGFGPSRDSFPPGNNQTNHQPSGRMTAVALAADGRRLYAGSFAGVWRSDDAGQTWSQLTWSQPGLGIVEAEIPGALLAPHIFDLVASPSDVNVVLASALDSQFINSKDGIYRTVDGGANWTLVLPSTVSCNIAFAPDNGQLVYIATGSGIAISQDAGATWRNVSVGGSVWHVAVAPLEPNGKRRVYAVGNSRIFGSLDGGRTWIEDLGVVSINATRKALHDFQVSCGSGGVGGFGGSIADAGGVAGQTLAIEPGNPTTLYLVTEGGANGPSFYTEGVPNGTLCNTTCARLAGEASLWIGDFQLFQQTHTAKWAQLPNPALAADTTPSGNAFVVTKATSHGFLIFFSDNSHVNVSAGIPTSAKSWHRLDGQDISVGQANGTRPSVHVDPHGIALTSDFDITLKPASGVSPPFDANAVLAQYFGGKIWMANDGGVYWSDDGGQNWKRSLGLQTLDPVNIAGLFGVAGSPALYFGCGDNDEFFTTDGGVKWGDPGEGCGDCDAWFSDNARADQVMHFLPRRGSDPLKGFIGIITSGSSSSYPNASDHSQNRYVPSTRRMVADPNPRLVPYASSDVVLRGFRPIIKTLATEAPLPDGDYVFIDQALDGTLRLVRTTAISSITQLSDWADPNKAPQIGSNLPIGVDIVQASGGHFAPVYYIGDRAGNVYKLDKTSGVWNKIVPKTLPGSSVSAALRWFVNPYEPNTIYVSDSTGVKVSTDGGASWHLDFWLTYNVTAAGKLQISSSLLQDMLFMRGEEWTRFAFGTAGVFWTSDFGIQWFTILNSFATPGRPESGFFDPISNLHDRVLYVECEGRSLVKISGIPEGPPFEPPPPVDLMLFAAVGEA